jgi:hypothetical protein
VTGGIAAGTIIRGSTTFTDLPIGRDAECAFAGPWATARWRAGRRPRQAQVYAVLSGSGRADERLLLDHGGTATGAAVIPLLERCWPAIRALAARIAEHSSVRHDDVCAALGLSTDPATMAVGLAHLRSGRTPGSFTVSRPAG